MLTLISKTWLARCQRIDQRRPDWPQPAIDPEEQRMGQEREAARTAQIFASTNAQERATARPIVLTHRTASPDFNARPSPRRQRISSASPERTRRSIPALKMKSIIIGCVSWAQSALSTILGVGAQLGTSGDENARIQALRRGGALEKLIASDRGFAKSRRTALPEEIRPFSRRI